MSSIKVSFYDKELAKSLIDAGTCIRFDVRIDTTIRESIASSPIANVDIGLILPDHTFVDLLKKSLANEGKI